MDKQVKSIIVICFMILIFAISLIYCNFIEGKESDEIIIDEPVTSKVSTSIPGELDPLLNGTINGIVYNVKQTGSYNSKYSTKGYYIYNSEDLSNATNVTISSGEKRTGGYSISIYNVDITEDHNVTIYVEEKNPEEDAVLTQALTYPTIGISFSAGVNEIKVVDNNGNSYERIN